MTRSHVFGLGVLMALLLSGALYGQGAATQERRFTFREGRSRAIDVTLTKTNGAATLTWPETAGDWDTALLMVDVSADPAALAPYIEISAGGVSDRQYFGAGDSGQRWLNLSFLRSTLKPASIVTIRGEGIATTAGLASLRLFAAVPDLTQVDSHIGAASRRCGDCGVRGVRAAPRECGDGHLRQCRCSDL